MYVGIYFLREMKYLQKVHVGCFRLGARIKVM
jgi:hypothetical protein